MQTKPPGQLLVERLQREGPLACAAVRIPGGYRFPSESRAGAWHEVKPSIALGRLLCSCEDAQYGTGKAAGVGCKHQWAYRLIRVHELGSRPGGSADLAEGIRRLDTGMRLIQQAGATQEYPRVVLLAQAWLDLARALFRAVSHAAPVRESVTLPGERFQRYQSAA